MKNKRPRRVLILSVTALGLFFVHVIRTIKQAVERKGREQQFAEIKL